VHKHGRDGHRTVAQPLLAVPLPKFGDHGVRRCILLTPACRRRAGAPASKIATVTAAGPTRGRQIPLGVAAIVAQRREGVNGNSL